jgi:hypothetical protein
MEGAAELVVVAGRAVAVIIVMSPLSHATPKRFANHVPNDARLPRRTVSDRLIE